MLRHSRESGIVAVSPTLSVFSYDAIGAEKENYEKKFNRIVVKSDSMGQTN